MKLGDALEKVLSWLGVTKERVQKYLGNCGCANRQRKLNELGTWAARWAAKLLLGGDKKKAAAELAAIMGEDDTNPQEKEAKA
jgi:hypothetical protein